MANKVKQFRFYSGDNNASKNQPAGVSTQAFIDGTLFNNYTPITQLGIQSLPGVKFYLNEAVEPVVIGSTGIYELDLNNMTQINALSIDQASMNIISENQSAYIIIDILYNDES